MINNTVNYFKKNIKLILFILIFCVLVFISNQNLQSLNYILKRGIVLEYSMPSSAKADKEKIKQKLNELNIKYSYIDETDNSEFNIYDFEEQKVEKSLFIALPYMFKDSKAPTINNISDYIFNNYENSKLIDVKTLNENYNDGYLSFLKFITLLFTSGALWLILMYLIYDTTTINKRIKESLVEYYISVKENLKKLVQNTKEKGISYLIVKILFDDNKNTEETNITKEVISTIIFVIVAVIIIRYFIGELRWIPSGSMKPTIYERDRVFVEKLDFPKKEIKRGDILVFYPPSTKLSNNPIAVFSRLSGIFCKDIAYIKRAIALPGEKFEIKKDDNSGQYRVYINDTPLNEPYISSKSEWTPCAENMNCGPFIIPENSYFMMGDNRSNSHDSRFWGFLDGSRIIGRANFMFWPIRRINVLKDKYLQLHKNKNESYVYIMNRYEY